jgi:hypothetical protein
MLSLLGLLAGATVVRVDVAENLPIETAHRIATTLAAAIEHDTGRTAVAETRPTGDCATDACVAEIRARTGAEDVVLLRLYRAISTIGLFAQVAGGRPHKVELDADEATWAPALSALAIELFPRKARSSARTVAAPHEAPPPPAATPPSPILPAIAVSLGGALTAASITLFVAADRRRSEIDGEIERGTVDGIIYGISHADAARRYDRVNAEVWAGIGLGVGAGALLLTGIVWWLLLE